MCNLVFLINIYESNKTHCQIDAMYLDFAKAFDQVPHSKLLSKLWLTGIANDLCIVMVQVLSLQKTPVCLSKWL